MHRALCVFVCVCIFCWYYIVVYSSCVIEDTSLQLFVFCVDSGTGSYTHPNQKL